MRIQIGHVSEIPLGQGKCFTIGRHEVAVFRARDGALFAVENRCPHRGGPLAEGIIGQAQVICPLHGYKFDLTTGHQVGGAECIKTYKIRQEGSSIVLSFEFPPVTIEEPVCTT